MARTLTEAGVRVLRSACGHDGFFRAAVCGTGTGEINIYEIPATDLGEATRLGFRELRTLAQAQETVCRP